MISQSPHHSTATSFRLPLSAQITARTQLSPYRLHLDHPFNPTFRKFLSYANRILFPLRLTLHLEKPLTLHLETHSLMQT